MTESPAGYGALRLLWEDETGTSNAATSEAGGPEAGVRLLRVTVTGRAERRRFRGACLAVTALTPHPGILAVHDAGFTGDDHPYLVTDLPRDNLAGRLAADGPLDVPAAAAIGRSLAATLGAAHDRGILHQDVRPGTVVWAAGLPLLADFGVTQAALAVGAAELSPEALVHAAREVFGWETASPATDVHGLASTIYTMLAGQPPYHSEALLGRAALYQRVLRGAPPPVPAPDVPARLSALLADMMAPDPMSRPAMAEVEAALAELAGPGRASRAATAVASPGAGSPGAAIAGAGAVAAGNPIAAALASPGVIGAGEVSASAEGGRAGGVRAADVAGVASAGGVAGTGGAGADGGGSLAGKRARSRYAPLVFLLAIGVIALLAGVVWGVVTAPGPAPRSTAAPAGSAGATAAVPLPPAQQASYRPRGVSVAAAGTGIRVSWSAPEITVGISAYIVIAERDGEPAQEKTLAPSALAAVFTGLPRGQRYCFVVGSLLQAASGQPETAAAAPACATVQP